MFPTHLKTGRQSLDCVGVRSKVFFLLHSSVVGRGQGKRSDPTILFRSDASLAIFYLQPGNYNKPKSA